MDERSVLGYNLFAYCWNNPVNHGDHSGAFLDTFLDLISLGQSIKDVIEEPSDCKNWINLGLDIFDVALPCVSGTGDVYRGCRTANKIIETIDDTHDTYKAFDNAVDAADTVRNAQNVFERETAEVVENFRKSQKALSQLSKEIERNAKKGIFISYDDAKVFDE